jgi:hypothetical protein
MIIILFYVFIFISVPPCTSSEWVIVVLCQLDNFSAMSWQEQVNFQWDDDEFHFVLDKHA